MHSSQNYLGYCKICNSKRLKTFLHTAKCKDCGILLFYPYPETFLLETRDDPESVSKYKKASLEWHQVAAKLNHINLTSNFLFAIENPDKIKSQIKILDYGAGPGQFALICKSFIPHCDIYSLDINDYWLLEEYKPFNIQIKWKHFEKDETKFDYIFLNDVFEHVDDCQKVLEILIKKLEPNGKIFIDTPKQFWLYSVSKFFSKRLYGKLLKGTVSIGHLQIWSKKSFLYIIKQKNLKTTKYTEICEFTLKPDFYLEKMGINNIFLIHLGNLFYKLAKKMIRNKIVCVLEKTL